MPRFSLLPFDQVLAGVREARSWYDDFLGISTSGTRLELIESKVSELLAELNSSASPEELIERWSNTDTYYTLSDGAGFGKICREIRRVGPNLLPRRTLRTILEGPLFPRDENPSNATVNARNSFAELELAADFSEKGVMPTGFDDLQFQFHGVNYEVQCKRLLSRSRVVDNIENAYRQLQRRMASDYDRGLIVLTAERVLGIDEKIFRVEREGDLTNEVHRLIEEFRTAFGSPWWNFIDTRVIGLVIVLRFLCYTVRHNVFGPAYYVSVMNLASPEIFQASELERLRDLVAHLQESTSAGTIPL